MKHGITTQNDLVALITPEGEIRTELPLTGFTEGVEIGDTVELNGANFAVVKIAAPYVYVAYDFTDN